MRSTFSSVVALMLLLIANAFAYITCYKGGPTWSNVGTEDAVNNALAELCKKLDGDCPLHREQSACQNVNGYAIHGHILPVQGPHGHIGVTIIQNACLDLVNQVKNNCDHGGSGGLLENHPDNYGGDWFKANVILDPNRGGC